MLYELYFAPVCTSCSVEGHVAGVCPYVVGSVLSYEINMKNVVFVTTFVSHK